MCGVSWQKLRKNINTLEFKAGRDLSVGIRCHLGPLPISRYQKEHLTMSVISSSFCNLLNLLDRGMPPTKPDCLCFRCLVFSMSLLSSNLPGRRWKFCDRATPPVQA
mmetsp:Transcript_80871/g.127330  ORF Transcript_80871/g.127330 Transcript_80871/m.127330 type:complete len:107 (+) Transcript_80871:212-532(+)